MNISIKATGIDEIEAELNKIAARAKNMQPLMENIGDFLEFTIHKSFEDERSVDGEEWSPLADSTLVYKQKHGEPFKLRSHDSTLFESIASTVDGTSVAVGVNAVSAKKGYEYPLVHQFGSKDGKTPARRFMPIDSNWELDDGVKEEILDLLEDFLAGL